MRTLKESKRDVNMQSGRRFFTKKLIEILLGNIHNPYLGRMIFSQIGSNLTDYHRLTLNNEFAYFKVTKGARNEICDPIQP